MGNQDDSLQKAYDEAVKTLLQLDPASNEYGTVFKRVQKLKAMLDLHKMEKPSGDTLVKTAGLLLSIAGVVAYETRNAWTTKGTMFLSKFI